MRIEKNKGKPLISVKTRHVGAVNYGQGDMLIIETFNGLFTYRSLLFANKDYIGLDWGVIKIADVRKINGSLVDCIEVLKDE